jgi:hypothetical protein
MDFDQLKTELFSMVKQMEAMNADMSDAVVGIGAGHAIAIVGIAELLISKGLISREEVQEWLLAGIPLPADQAEQASSCQALARILALLERGYPKAH